MCACKVTDGGTKPETQGQWDLIKVPKGKSGTGGYKERGERESKRESEWESRDENCVSLWNKLIVWPRGQVTSTRSISSCRFNELDTGGETTSAKSNLSLFVSEPGTLIPLGYLHHHLDRSAFLPLGPPLRGWPTSFLALNDSSSPEFFYFLSVNLPPDLAPSQMFLLTTFMLILFICENTAGTGTSNAWTSIQLLVASYSKNISHLHLYSVYYAVDQRTQNTQKSPQLSENDH